MATAPVEAQCAMCRASVQNNAAFVRGLNLGVLVLLTPPVAIFFSIFIVAYRHRKGGKDNVTDERSEEHTSELQSQSNLVCRLLLEKKKNNYKSKYIKRFHNPQQT